MKRIFSIFWGTLVPRILTVDYTFKLFLFRATEKVERLGQQAYTESRNGTERRESRNGTKYQNHGME